MTTEQPSSPEIVRSAPTKPLKVPGRRPFSKGSRGKSTEFRLGGFV
jgi:hypothetical protein